MSTPRSPDVSQLWNRRHRPRAHRPGTDSYQAAVLEQWKTCVEMAERISGRRALTNTFFLGINTVAVTLFGAFWQTPPTRASTWWLLLPVTVLVVVCASWWVLVRSYRRLSSAKFDVVHTLEQQLPASPFRHEWRVLRQKGSGYVRLTLVEQLVPVLFAIAYVVAAGLALATAP